MHPGRANYQAPNGEWKPIDNRLVAREDSRADAFENAAGKHRVRFGSRANAREVVRVGEPGASLSFRPSQKSDSVGIVTDNEITYNDVFDGVDLKYVRDCPRFG